MKPIKRQWVVVFPGGAVAYWSLAYTKSYSIELYVGDLVVDKKAYWREQVLRGHKCVKVNVIFEEYESVRSDKTN